ncbi:hypothetical protein AB0B83_26370 [Micromonospora sp. NPDC049060]
MITAACEVVSHYGPQCVLAPTSGCTYRTRAQLRATNVNYSK